MRLYLSTYYIMALVAALLLGANALPSATENPLALYWKFTHERGWPLAFYFDRVGGGNAGPQWSYGSTELIVNSVVCLLIVVVIGTLSEVQARGKLLSRRGLGIALIAGTALFVFSSMIGGMRESLTPGGFVTTQKVLGFPFELDRWRYAGLALNAAIWFSVALVLQLFLERAGTRKD